MRARGSEVADLLRDLRRVAEMPADDPVRQEWMVRKQDLLDRVEEQDG